MAFGPDLAQGLRAVLAAAGTSSALADPATRPFDMGRGPSPGWVLVTPDGIATDSALAGWVHQALAFVSTLPAR